MSFAMATVLGLAFAPSAFARPDTCAGEPARHFPARPHDADGGSAFIERIRRLDDDAREAAIRTELLAGNVPGFLRELQPVRLATRDGSSAPTEITLCVAPDYLSVGTDEDHVLMPMRLATALEIAERFGFVLPTSRIVDAIYMQANLRLPPQPLPPSSEMRSTTWLERHNRLVRGQFAQSGAERGVLVAGHKKDLVLTNAFWRLLDRVAIYGWHRSAQSPIQTLSLWHGYRYADYSHGVRLVSATANIGTATQPVTDALADPHLASALSAEGVVARLADLMQVLRRAGTRRRTRRARRALSGGASCSSGSRGGSSRDSPDRARAFRASTARASDTNPRARGRYRR